MEILFLMMGKNKKFRQDKTNIGYPIWINTENNVSDILTKPL